MAVHDWHRPRFNHSALALAQRRRKSWEFAAPDLIDAMLNRGPRGRLGRETDTTLPHKHIRFDLLGPVGPPCTDLEGFGKATRGVKDLETKMACGLSRVPAPCWVISIGNSNQWGFEAEVLARTACSVAVFDCTIGSSVTPPPHLQSRVALHHVCLGQPEATAGAAKGPAGLTCHTRRATGSACDHVGPFANYSQLLALAGIDRTPSFLKMDIEGFEWQVLPHMLAAPNAPVQLAVELHFQTQMKQLAWFGRFKTPVELFALGNLMWRSGYVIASRQDNRFCPWCTELLLARAFPPSVSGP